MHESSQRLSYTKKARLLYGMHDIFGNRSCLLFHTTHYCRCISDSDSLTIVKIVMRHHHYLHYHYHIYRLSIPGCAAEITSIVRVPLPSHAELILLDSYH